MDLSQACIDACRKWAEAAGLRCIGQEWIKWGSPLLIDCLSTFTRQGSVWDVGNRVVKNRRFMDEARCAQRRASLAPRRRAA
ncbi:MAG: hypothetical protein JW888_01135 [Pirellulales bacterium]|nr:hypothetical protein [Pirellulales bacterium]